MSRLNRHVSPITLKTSKIILILSLTWTKELLNDTALMALEARRTVSKRLLSNGLGVICLSAVTRRSFEMYIADVGTGWSAKKVFWNKYKQLWQMFESTSAKKLSDAGKKSRIIDLYRIQLKLVWLCVGFCFRRSACYRNRPQKCIKTQKYLYNVHGVFKLLIQVIKLKPNVNYIYVC